MPQVALAYVGSSIGASLATGTAMGSVLGGVIGSAVGGGIGSAASGGDFWKGALTSGISAGIGASGLGGSITAGFEGLGLSSGLAGAATSGLLGGAQTALSGGNFLEGAVAGAVMPTVMSGAKNVLEGWGSTGTTGGATGMWGGNAPKLGTYDSEAGTWSSPTSAQAPQEWGTNVDYSLAGIGGLGSSPNPSIGPVGSAASGGSSNILSGALGKLVDKNTLIPSLLNTGTNLYMQSQSEKLAKQMASKADPYANFRGGDAASYNALLNNPNSVFDDPSYKAMAKQGDEALMRQAAAMGMTDSGALTSKLSEQRMALANQFYQNRLAQYGAGGGVGYNPAGAVQAASPFYTNNYLAAALNNPLQTQSRTGYYA